MRPTATLFQRGVLDRAARQPVVDTHESQTEGGQFWNWR